MAVRDERGHLARRVKQGRAWGLRLNAAEQARLNGQVEALRQRVQAEPKDVLEFFELGLLCLEMDQAGLWRRDPRYAGHRSFARLAVALTGKHSRQSYDRWIQVARVFTRETAEEFHEAGVGMRVLSELSSADWRVRTVLKNQALEGTSARTLFVMKAKLEGVVRRHAQSPQDTSEALLKKLLLAVSEAKDEEGCPRHPYDEPTIDAAGARISDYYGPTDARGQPLKEVTREQLEQWRQALRKWEKRVLKQLQEARRLEAWIKEQEEREPFIRLELMQFAMKQYNALVKRGEAVELEVPTELPEG